MNHTVAMTGDGVNDVLALKEADCSIAMASGVDAARQVANLVLLENQFSALPSVLDEGRRVINNITRSGSLVLVQVLFSILITMGTLLSGTAYPFEPIQLTIINACFVGIPTFLLNFEPDFNRIKGAFLSTIFKNAFPASLSIAIGTLLIINIGHLFGSSGQAFIDHVCDFYCMELHLDPAENLSAKQQVPNICLLRHTAPLLYRIDCRKRSI